MNAQAINVRRINALNQMYLRDSSTGLNPYSNII
jgi:hypothetical protein